MAPPSFVAPLLLAPSTRRAHPPLFASTRPRRLVCPRANYDFNPGPASNRKATFPNAAATPSRSRSSIYKYVAQDAKYPPGKLPFALELDFVLNHPVADGLIAALVVLNCLVFALQTIDVGPALHQAFVSYEKNLSVFFLLEYFSRWYGKGLSPRFLLSRGMLIDFIAVAPLGFTVTDQSEALFVRILRLSRILRIQRVVMDTDRSAEVMGSMTNIQISLARIGLSVFSLLYVSAGLFFQVEKDINPNVLNFFDALYFSTITLFTVGFGDVTPLTSWGRLSKFARLLVYLAPRAFSPLSSIGERLTSRGFCASHVSHVIGVVGNVQLRSSRSSPAPSWCPTNSPRLSACDKSRKKRKATNFHQRPRKELRAGLLPPPYRTA